MKIKDNLFIYICFGVGMYLLNTMNIESFQRILEYVVISTCIGKTIEILSYKFSAKVKLNIFSSMVFALIILSIILYILMATFIVKNKLITIIASICITIFMTVLLYKRSVSYNKKLDELKKTLKEDSEYENN